MRKSPSSNPIDHFGDTRPKRRDGRAKTAPPRNPYGPPVPPPLDRAGTLHWMQFVKTDAWWRSQMPVPQSAMEEVLGLPPGWLRHMLQEHPNFSMTNVMPKIAWLIPDIERRALVFPDKIHGDNKTKKTTPSFLWLEPPDPPFRINRLCPESNWSLWARCRFCGSNQFLPVIIDSKPHVACYNCIKPNQHPAIGATLVKKSLIHEALKNFC